MNYQHFLTNKLKSFTNIGFDINLSDINPILFDWQKTIVKWALKKGRCLIAEDCGLGKTFQSLEWSRIIHERIGGNILILAPLAVSQQTQREGIKLGIKVNIAKDQSQIVPGINITNYERLNKFNPLKFIAIVLDEGSIMKNFSGKIRNDLIEGFSDIKYKMVCTATPAPNSTDTDYSELGNYSEFLGIMKRTEMLSTFFINDSGDTGKWRLKGHVKDNLFWKWLASWAVMIRKPSDIGFSDIGYELPELKLNEIIVKYDGKKQSLFVDEVKGVSDRLRVRRETIKKRCIEVMKIVDCKNNYISWVNLNDESKMLTELTNGIEISGSDSIDFKESTMLKFADNQISHLITKPKIAGLGMNWQNCNHINFVGLSDSFEQYYQAIRRCWRFGQTKPVTVNIIIEEREGKVLNNIKAKEKNMIQMYDSIVGYLKEEMQNEIFETKRIYDEYKPCFFMQLPEFVKEECHV